MPRKDVRIVFLSRETAGKRWHIRPDGPDKVTGKLKYLTDLTTSGMLIGKVLRSEHPHAWIVSINTERAEQIQGVHAVITHKDVPGLNRFGIAIPDQPVLCEDRVRYVGDAVAAVAAESEEIAEYALKQIEVKYEPLPVIDDPEQGMSESAPKLHLNGNILHRTNYARGDIEAAFLRCEHIVEDTYYTPRQMHAYMETEGGLFVPEADGRLTVYAPTQHGFKDRMQLSRILEMPESMIRVISSPIGGSFGGKDELNIQPYGALLALKSGMPVKIHNSRWESVRAGLKRHPMKITMKTGVDREGRIIAHQVKIIADTGAYATLGAPVLNFATEHSVGPYRIPHVKIEGISVYTNNGVSGEFRGFGGNQVIFAVESQIERLAEKLNMDPWEFRKRNLRKSKDPGPFGQRIAESDGANQVWESISKSHLWAKRSQQPQTNPSAPWLKRGIGAAIAMHGAGLGFGIADPSGGRISLNKQGKIEVAFSFEEFGQGILATLELMLMDFFQCEKEDLKIVIGDTDIVPHSGSATASRSTTMAFMALKKLKPPFETNLLKVASKLTELPIEVLKTGPGGVWKKGSDGTNQADEFLISYRDIAEKTDRELVFKTEFQYPTTPDNIMGGHYLYSHTAVVVEVEVNLLTGQVHVVDNHHAVAAGPAINPMGYIGQIEGGSVMALGFTLCEDALMQKGEYLTQNLDTYLIPTVCDIHDSFELDAIEELPPDDPFGPRGIGEVGSVALAPAITAAVYHATGKRITMLPISKEEIIESFSVKTLEGVDAK